MKKLQIFCLLVLLSPSVYSKQIILNIPDRDIEIVERSVISAEQWIKEAWEGKLNKSKERAIKKEIDISIKEGKEIPAGEEAILDKHLERPKEVREETRISR